MLPGLPEGYSVLLPLIPTPPGVVPLQEPDFTQGFPLVVVHERTAAFPDSTIETFEEKSI